MHICMLLILILIEKCSPHSLNYERVALKSSANRTTTTLDLGIQLPFGGNNYTTHVPLTFRLARYAIEFAIRQCIDTHLFAPNVNLHFVDTFHPTSWDSVSLVAADFLLSLNVDLVLGDGTSPQTLKSAALFGVYGIPMCSPYATHPALSSKDEFPTFFRTLPSQETIGDQVALFFSTMKWRRVGVFYDETFSPTIMRSPNLLDARSDLGILNTFQLGSNKPDQLCAQIFDTDTRILLVEVVNLVPVFTVLEKCNFFDGNHVIVMVGPVKPNLAGYMARSEKADFFRRAPSHILSASLTPPDYGSVVDGFYQNLAKSDFPFKRLNITRADLQQHAVEMGYVIGCAYSLISGWDKNQALKRNFTDALETDPLRRMSISDFNQTQLNSHSLQFTHSGDWIPNYFSISGIRLNSKTVQLDSVPYLRVGLHGQGTQQTVPFAFMDGFVPLDGPQQVVLNAQFSDPFVIALLSVAGLILVFILAVSARMYVNPPPRISRITVGLLCLGSCVSLVELPAFQGVPTVAVCHVRLISAELGFAILLCAAYSWIRLRFLVFDTGRPVTGERRHLTILYTVVAALFAFKCAFQPPLVVISVDTDSSVLYTCTPPFDGWVDAANAGVTAVVYYGMAVHGLYMAMLMRRFDGTATRFAILVACIGFASLSVLVSVFVSVPLLVAMRSMLASVAAPLVIYFPAHVEALRRCHSAVKKKLLQKTPRCETLMANVVLTPAPPVLHRRPVQQWSVPYASKWSGLGLFKHRGNVAPAKVIVIRHIVTVEWHDRVYSDLITNVLIQHKSRNLVCVGRQVPHRRADSLSSIGTGDALSVPRSTRSRATSLGARHRPVLVESACESIELAHVEPQLSSCLRIESLRFCFFLQFLNMDDLLAFCLALRDEGCENVAVPLCSSISSRF